VPLAFLTAHNVDAQGMKLFVGCLPFSKTEADVQALFEHYGPLLEVALLRNGDGSSRGAAFVTFQDAQAANTAMSCCQGYVFNGSPRGIKVSIATSTGSGSNTTSLGMGGRHAGGISIPPVSKFQMQTPQSKRPQHSQVPHQQGWADMMLHGSAGGMVASPPGSKCFVGQLPYSKEERDLWRLFGTIGPIQEVVMLKPGAAFVRFSMPQLAQAAVAALNGFAFDGATRPITVQIAQDKCSPSAAIFPMIKRSLSMNSASGNSAPQGLPEGCKVFVGQLPFSRKEEEIKEVFQQYGHVVEVKLHRNPATGELKGGAFINFASPEYASMALQLDGYMFPGATRPICVAMAGEGLAKKRKFG